MIIARPFLSRYRDRSDRNMAPVPPQATPTYQYCGGCGKIWCLHPHHPVRRRRWTSGDYAHDIVARASFRSPELSIEPSQVLVNQVLRLTVKFFLVSRWHSVFLKLTKQLSLSFISSGSFCSHDSASRTKSIKRECSSGSSCISRSILDFYFCSERWL